MTQLVLPIARRSAAANYNVAAPTPLIADTVIFLDVDGVLHSLYGEDLFRESCCALLRRIVQTTGASLVLSSTWRTEPGKIAVLNGVLRQWGMNPVVDRTKELDDFPREFEICEWLDRHPHVARWIAIDDMDLQGADTVQAKRLCGHAVRTNANTGLLSQDADLAIQLLFSQSGVWTTPSSCPARSSPTAPGFAVPSPSSALWTSPAGCSSWMVTPAGPDSCAQTPSRTPHASDFHSPLASPVRTPVRRQLPESSIASSPWSAASSAALAAGAAAARALVASAAQASSAMGTGGRAPLPSPPLPLRAAAAPVAATRRAAPLAQQQQQQLGESPGIGPPKPEGGGLTPQARRSHGQLHPRDRKHLDAMGCSPRLSTREPGRVSMAARRRSSPLLPKPPVGDGMLYGRVPECLAEDGRCLDAIGCSPCSRGAVAWTAAVAAQLSPCSPNRCGFEVADTRGRLMLGSNPLAC